MFHKRFSIQVIIRVALITTTAILLSTIFGDKNLFFNQLILFSALAGEIAELIYFLNHTNRELRRLFLAIKHSDFSISFRDNSMGRSFRELHDSFTEVVDAYRRVKVEQEIQYQFLQKLIQQIHVGIISIEGDHIELMNATAEKILGIEGVKSWQVLKQLNPRVADDLDSIGDDGRRLLEIKLPQETRVIAADVSTMTILEKPYRLVTLQDINTAMDQKEIEAWHKLIRILTHEIMNSVTPMTSLTETMQGLLTTAGGEQKKIHELNDETITDIRFSLNTIQKRSEGLLQFVDNYRKLSRVPKPVPEPVLVKEFLETVSNLMSSESEKAGVTLTVSVDPDVTLFRVDRKLVEQVMLNLLRNSLHAVAPRGTGSITVSASRSDNRIVIAVTDDGVGIPEKELNEIFTPFFSTRRDGSGIGLSLSKQIMTLHGGSIKVSSQQGVGTTFYLHFRESGNAL